MVSHEFFKITLNFKREKYLNSYVKPINYLSEYYGNWLQLCGLKCWVFNEKHFRDTQKADIVYVYFALLYLEKNSALIQT